MAYDERLAARLLEAFEDAGVEELGGVEEKKMFGGMAVMVRGHMTCGVVKNQMMVRVGLEQHEECLEHKHAAPMDFTGKPMKSMVYVLPEGCRTAAQLTHWVKKALAFNATQKAK